jgi:hypothetical protein
MIVSPQRRKGRKVMLISKGSSAPAQSICRPDEQGDHGISIMEGLSLLCALCAFAVNINASE